MRIDTKKAQPKPLRPRGRPRAYDADAALGKARDVFWAAGYNGTSLDDLAAATGMNRPSLYAAFGDKRTLYLKALARFRQDMGADVGAALESTPRLGDALRRFYAAALGQYFSGTNGPRGCMVFCTATTEAHLDATVRACLEEILGELDAVLAQRFRRARDEGEIAADADVSSLGRLAAATLHSIALRARAGQPRAGLKRLAEASVRMLTRAASA